jgi:hypothetical protein
MRKINLLILLLGVSSYAKAQQDIEAIKKRMIDSITDVRIDEAALMYPRIRQFSITHQQNMMGNIKSRLHGNEFFKGQFSSARTTINMNVPIINRGKNTFITSLGVVHQFFGISEVTNYDARYRVAAMNNYMPMINLGLTYSRRDSLFGHPVTYTASISGLFNPSFSRRQFSFTGLVSVPLIRNENTNLIGGVVVLIDPASPAPAFLFLSYFHKFKSLGLELMVDLPYRAALRKPISKSMSLSVFGELAGSNSFFEFEGAYSGLPQRLTYSSLEIKSGLLFEYRATRKAVLSMSAGVNATVTSKIFEQGEKPGNYFIKNNNNAVPYVQAGLSLLPFWRPFR